MKPTEPPGLGIVAVNCDWNEVPHLDESAKAALLEDYPAYQRDARSRGIPMLGSGVIFPVPEDVFLEDPFEIPRHWPRAFGLDVGWNRTAAVWGALEHEADTVHLYSEHYVGEATPPTHADAIKARGDWIPGVIDPASRGRSQLDGQKLRDEYTKLGLHLSDADNAVEAGLHAMYRRLSSGRLKVFRTLNNWRSEQRLYRRDEKGKIVKERDHLMDASRYLLMSGMRRAITEPMPFRPHKVQERRGAAGY